MNIAIIGVGGVGGYYGGVLARAGQDVAVLARGENLEAIRQAGLTVEEPDGERYTTRVRATPEPAELAGAELVLVAVKSYAIDDVAPAVAGLALAGATVLPLLNGVDIAERLAAAGVPDPSILGGLTYISAARLAPGVIQRRSDFRTIMLGERLQFREPGSNGDDRARRIAAAFEGTGVDVQVTEQIETELWRKFVFIAAVSAVCGLAHSPIGAVREAPMGPALIRRAVHEVVAVGRARGVALDPGEGEAVIERIMGLAPGLRPSFLLDLEAGGPDELDTLSGAVARLGAQTSVETPVHDTAVAALGA